MSEAVAVISKNARERIQVALTEYNGRELLDVRVYYTDGTGDEWKPTRKGLTVRRDRGGVAREPHNGGNP